MARVFLFSNGELGRLRCCRRIAIRLSPRFHICSAEFAGEVAGINSCKRINAASSIHHLLAGIIMATFEINSGTTTPLWGNGCNAVHHGAFASSRSPQQKINRIKAIVASPVVELSILLPVNAAPSSPAATPRRPGMAARWKGLHRLAISI